MIDRVENKSKIFTTLLAIYFLATPLDYILPHFGSATVLFAVGLVISAFAVFLVFGHERARLTGDQVCIFLLALFMIASNFWAKDTARAYTYTFSFVATAAMYFLLFFFKFSKKEIEIFETASIIGAVLFIIYVFTKIDLSLVMAGYRLDLGSVGNDEYFSDPNGLAARLMMPLIFAVKRIFGSEDKRLKALYVAIMGVMVYIILLTGSRTAVITMAVIFVAISSSFDNKRVTTLGIIAVLAVVVVLLVPDILPEHIVDRIFNLEKYQEVTTLEGDRFDIWKNILLEVFPLSPVWGHGAGNASRMLYDFYGFNKSVHSSWFTMLADLGIIGFVLWMTFIFGKLKLAYNMRKKNVYVFAVAVSALIMASTLDAVMEKYLWTGLLYVHLIDTAYTPEENIKTKKSKR